MSEPNDAMKAALIDWLKEAVELRGELGLSPYDELLAPWQVVEQLSMLRITLDRVEELLVKAVRAKAQITRIHRRTQDDLQVEWDRHVTNQSAVRRPVLTQEYVTGKEKFAEANLATLELRQKERRSLELLSFSEETLDVIRTIHRGLEGVRQDLLTQVKALQVESHLER